MYFEHNPKICFQLNLNCNSILSSFQKLEQYADSCVNICIIHTFIILNSNCMYICLVFLHIHVNAHGQLQCLEKFYCGSKILSSLLNYFI